MIEESVLENERRGNFIRVFPNENHMSYRNFFEEERVAKAALAHQDFLFEMYEHFTIKTWKNIVLQ